MATRLTIDDRLILDAQKIGGHKTKREAVTRALEEYVQRRQQLKIIRMFGTVDIDRGYH